MHKLAKTLAGLLGEKLQADQDQIEIFAYSLEVLLGTVLEIFTILFLAFLLNILGPTSICLLVFSSIRFLGGGVHCNTYLKCLVTGCLLLLGLGKLAALPLNPTLLSSTWLLALLLSIYAVSRWIPAGTAKKVIRDEAVRLKQRRKVSILLGSWLVAGGLFIHYSLAAYALAVLLGIVSSLFLSSPWGYQTIKTLDNFIDKFLIGIFGKEVKSNV